MPKEEEKEVGSLTFWKTKKRAHHAPVFLPDTSATISHGKQIRRVRKRPDRYVPLLR